MGLPAPQILTAGRFPKIEVETVLRTWWQEQEGSSARYGDPFADARISAAGTVFDIQPRVSSQEAVTVLTRLKNVLGYEPPTSVIKRGGYKSRDEFIQDLSSRVNEEYAKRHS